MSKSKEELAEEAFNARYPMPEKPFYFCAGPKGYLGYKNTLYFKSKEEAEAGLKEYRKEHPSHGYGGIYIAENDAFLDPYDGPNRGDSELFYTEGFLAGYQAAEPKWIPYAERLPDIGKHCVGFRRIMGTSSIVFWSSAGQWMFAYEPEFASDITHWMPLPAAPKEDEK